MKIKDEDFEALRKLVSEADTEAARATALAANHSDRRYRWDLTYTPACTRLICSTLYKYCEDSHIDTALRAIVKPLRGK